MYMFGHCLDALEYPDFSAPLLLNIQLALPLLWVIKSFPWVVPILVILPKRCGRRIYEQFHALLFVRSFLIDWLDRTAQEVRLKIHSDPALITICHRLFDPLAKASLVFPSMQSIIDESLSLLQAGSDTVGNTCTVGMFYILNDKVVHTQLIAELRAQWPDKTVSVDLSFLQKLPYLVSSFLFPNLIFCIDQATIYIDCCHKRIFASFSWICDTSTEGCRPLRRQDRWIRHPSKCKITILKHYIC